MFTVVVPAHDEEAVIGRSLAAMTADRAPGEFEVVVVCNGCSDGTAAVAAAVEGVRVVETPVAGKAHALNLGDAAATGFPRCYADADVRIDTAGLRALVAAVERGPELVAVPAPRFELTGRPWAVRAFFAVWTRLPFFTDGEASSGVYVLSERARARFGAFPDLLADDHWTLGQFTAAERRAVPEAVSVVEAPRRLGDVVRIKTRVFLGERQLAAAGHVDAGPPAGGRGSWLSITARDPRLWPAAVVYAGVNVVAELRARRRFRTGDYRWERDETSRRAPGTGE